MKFFLYSKQAVPTDHVHNYICQAKKSHCQSAFLYYAKRQKVGIAEIVGNDAWNSCRCVRSKPCPFIPVYKICYGELTNREYMEWFACYEGIDGGERDMCIPVQYSNCKELLLDLNIVPPLYNCCINRQNVSSGPSYCRENAGFYYLSKCY